MTRAIHTNFKGYSQNLNYALIYLLLFTFSIITNHSLIKAEYILPNNHEAFHKFDNRLFARDQSNAVVTTDINNDTDSSQSPLIHYNTNTSLFIASNQTQKSLQLTSSKFCSIKSQNETEDSVIKVGFLTNIHGHWNPQRQGIVISGALTYAISRVNQDLSRFNGKRIELIASDTEGHTIIGTSAVIDQWRRGAAAFFGPEDSCEVEATIASAINLPMISYKCADSKASNKHFYKTFLRTHPSDTQIVSSVIALLDNFNWKKFSIISEKSIQYQTVALNLADKARALGFTINHEKKFENIYACCLELKPCCQDSMFYLIEETFRTTRIYLFLGTIRDLNIMLQVMQVKNLLNGDYLVIYIDLDQYSVEDSYKYFWRVDMDEQLKKPMTEAARSLMVVVTSPPDEGNYSDFKENVRSYNTLPPFSFSQPLFPEKKYRKHITIYASYLYDAFMLYADALEEAIKDGSDIYDGAAIVRRIINRKSYRSITGPWMSIDPNGDVEGNYTVLALRSLPPNSKLKTNDFNYSMLPVYTFHYDNNYTLRLQGNATPLSWINSGRIPLDEPICKYDGRECRKPPDSTKSIIAIIELVILITLSIIVFQVYRNWTKEQEIAGLLWKMDFEDVLFHDGILHRTNSRTSFISQMSNDSAAFIKNNRNTFTKTATYKGVRVAIKELKFSGRKDKDIPRASKVEMKIMKEIRHDNINQFIGACIKPETNIIYIATEYCSKGSLQDILDNNELKLDSMFVSSLVFDLISGLNYLHNSELMFHGNLKSSNCLITSRWVLKITDFGLHNFREKLTEPKHENMRHTHYRNQLWQAPELLRNRSLLGNQKTDIYAFGIILHEIIARHGPFGIDITSLKPEDVVDSIKNPKAYSNIAEAAIKNDLQQQHTYGTSKSNCQTTSSLANVAQKTIKSHLNNMSRNESQSDFEHQSYINFTQENRFKDYIQLEQYNSNKSNQLIYKNLNNESQLQISLPQMKADSNGYNDDNPNTPFLGNNNEIKIANQAVSVADRTSARDKFLFIRPDTHRLSCPQYIIDTMRDCWSEKPELRPDLRTIRRRLEKMRQGTKHNIMDNMMIMMERYANNLEEIVQERTARLVEEKKKTEILLYRMLPPSVAGQLMIGEEVEPESFDAVSLFFSDIVKFTEMSSKSTPMEVVVFLNELYTLFDAIIQEYKVYKVETIGDAYMVVSGLPERIDNHASEIASMAIELLKSVKNFRIPHLPNEVLQLRIGLHTGPVVAGVVGTTMPRYCLFGDTVNTANRMESHGEALKIHTSPQFKEHLDNSGLAYKLISRGPTQIKGKGLLETFWLLGHLDETAQFRHDPSISKSTVGLFDAIGQKRSPRALHHNNQLISSNYGYLN